jgi:tRNA dimethylallyltransferase
MPPKLPPLVVIAGPTASGKSALALQIAEREEGVVINADASQCFADLRILSARPDEAELARAPHRLYGFLDAGGTIGAAGWAALARAEIAATHRAGRLPIVVGGTGLYLRTLLQGIAEVPPIDPAVRCEVRAMDTAALAEALAGEDPVMAARLSPTDTQRMARALEVVRSSRRSLAEWQRSAAGGIEREVELRPMVVEVDRAALLRRCDVRFDAMMARGALAEVQALAARGLDPALPVMKAIGVPPLLRHLAGEWPLAEAIARAKLDTRRYVKRQLTWLRNQLPDWPRAAR